MEAITTYVMIMHSGCFEWTSPGVGLYAGMRPHYFTPLAALIAPSVLIGFGVVIPGSCIAGVNQLTIGFASTLVGACISYWMGIRSVVSDRRVERPRLD
jgi:hypothetical protein